MHIFPTLLTLRQLISVWMDIFFVTIKFMHTKKNKNSATYTNILFLCRNHNIKDLTEATSAHLILPFICCLHCSSKPSYKIKRERENKWTNELIHFNKSRNYNNKNCTPKNQNRNGGMFVFNDWHLVISSLKHFTNSYATPYFSEIMRPCQDYTGEPWNPIHPWTTPFVCQQIQDGCRLPNT